MRGREICGVSNMLVICTDTVDVELVKSSSSESGDDMLPTSARSANYVHRVLCRF